jgi:protein TonB
MAPLPEYAPVAASVPVPAPVPVTDAAQPPLAERILAEARDALDEGKADEGEQLIQLAGEAGVPANQLDELVGRARELRITSHANAMSRLSQLFNDRIAQGKLLEPETDSAKYYLRELTSAEPGHPSTKLAQDALTARFVSETRAAVNRSDLPAARSWVAQAEGSGAEGQIVVALKQEIAAAQKTEASADEFVAATALTKLHNVNPEYPGIARDRGTEGWVELAITIETNGSVGAIAVTRAEPAGVFDAAATAAARQWRYAPIQRNGQAVSQRTKVRIRFELK